jgi:hypothetical protein
MKKIVLISSLFFSIFSTNTGAASYAYYGSLDDVGNKKDWTEVLSYKYATGKLLIIQQDSKALDLKDGVYEFNDGTKFVVKDDAVLDKDKEKNEKPKKDDKKDKLKDFKL